MSVPAVVRSRRRWIGGWIVTWIVAVLTGTAASTNYLMMVTISVTCAAIHLWCAIKMKRAGVPEWVLWVGGFPLGLLSIESLWRLVEILRGLMVYMSAPVD